MKSIKPIVNGIADIIAIAIIFCLFLIFWLVDSIREKKKKESEESSFRRYIKEKYSKYNLPVTKPAKA